MMKWILSNKPTEIRVYSQKEKAPITASAEVKINLSKWKAPSEGVYMVLTVVQQVLIIIAYSKKI